MHRLLLCWRFYSFEGVVLLIKTRERKLVCRKNFFHTPLIHSVKYVQTKDKGTDWSQIMMIYLAYSQMLLVVEIRIL